MLYILGWMVRLRKLLHQDCKMLGRCTIAISLDSISLSLASLISTIFLDLRFLFRHWLMLSKFFEVSFAIWNIFRKISVYDRILDKFVIIVSGMFINFPSRSKTCQFCRPSVLDYSYSYFHIKVVQLSKDLTYFIHCVFLLEHACLSWIFVKFYFIYTSALVKVKCVKSSGLYRLQKH